MLADFIASPVFVVVPFALFMVIPLILFALDFDFARTKFRFELLLLTFFQGASLAEKVAHLLLAFLLCSHNTTLP